MNYLRANCKPAAETIKVDPLVPGETSAKCGRSTRPPALCDNCGEAVGPTQADQQECRSAAVLLVPLKSIRPAFTQRP